MTETGCKETNCDEAIGLLMTYRCNLDCKYCYIHTKRSKDMTLEKAQHILDPFLMKVNKLDIIFVGGETLLAINVIRPLIGLKPGSGKVIIDSLEALMGRY